MRDPAAMSHGVGEGGRASAAHEPQVSAARRRGCPCLLTGCASPAAEAQPSESAAACTGFLRPSFPAVQAATAVAAAEAELSSGFQGFLGVRLSSSAWFEPLQGVFLLVGSLGSSSPLCWKVWGLFWKV